MPNGFETGSARDLYKDGIWFRDPEGRYVLFRGVNFASRSKRPPYLPLLPLDTRELDNDGIKRFRTELAAVQPEFDRMKNLGFTVVRLLVIWKAIEPTPNPNLEQLLPEGEIYLTLIKEVVDALYARGIFSFINFHQDIAHEVYGGDGFPDWALAIDETHERPEPPSDLRDTQWGLHYYAFQAGIYLNDIPLVRWNAIAPLVRYTLASFWQNNLHNIELSDHELNDNTAQYPRTHLEKTIGAAARFFQTVHDGRGHPGILGYELFNEPHPVGLGKHKFEERLLPEFYQNAVREIRRDAADGQAGDQKAFIFIEPRMDWTTFDADGEEFGGFSFTQKPKTFLHTEDLADERIVFSFHYYDPWTVTWGSDNMHNKQREWPDVYKRLLEAATSRNLVPFLTEFGGSQDWEKKDTDLRPDVYQHKQIRAYMDLSYQQVETYLLNATYWNYDLYNDDENKDNWNLENLSLLGPNRVARHHDIIARPYPLRSSAEPYLVRFDVGTKHCSIVLKGKIVDATTMIYVPSHIHYEGGFGVRATSPNLLWDDVNQMLHWLPDPERELNHLILFPAGAFDKNALHLFSRLLFEFDRTLEQTVNLCPKVELVGVGYDPEGVDLSLENVIVRNTGVNTVKLTGWTLQDVFNHAGAKPHVFTFPDFALAAGAEVRVWSKKGTSDEGNLFWGRMQAAWNYKHDTIILRDASGVEVSRLSFPAYTPGVALTPTSDSMWMFELLGEEDSRGITWLFELLNEGNTGDSAWLSELLDEDESSCMRVTPWLSLLS